MTGEDDVDQGMREAVAFTNKQFGARCMLAPISIPRMMWDLVAMMIVALECFLLPLQFFATIRTSGTVTTIRWFIRVYWTLDMPLHFFTGYTLPGGHVEMQWRRVSRRYLKSWFLFDVALLIADWSEFFAAIDGQAQKTGGFSRFVRSLRMIRVARALRLLWMVQSAEVPQQMRGLVRAYVRSEIGFICFSISRICVCWLWFQHVLACCFYALGVSGDSQSSWIIQKGLGGESEWDLYVASFHWSMSLFASEAEILPKTTPERIYVIFAALSAYLVDAYIVSSITTSMTRLSIATAQDTKKILALKGYLYENGISAKVSSRVQLNALHALEEQKRRTPESEIELLGLLSEPLRMELHYEIYRPVLAWHPFFDICTDQCGGVMRQLCHRALAQITLAKDDVLFWEGELVPSSQMYFLTGGIMKYERPGKKDDKGVQTANVGQWFCEAVLWTAWTHRGSCTSLSSVALLAICADQFHDVAVRFPDSMDYARRYAGEFVKYIRQCDDCDLTDMEDIDMAVSWLASKSRTAMKKSVTGVQIVPAETGYRATNHRMQSLFHAVKIRPSNNPETDFTVSSVTVDGASGGTLGKELSISRKESVWSAMSRGCKRGSAALIGMPRAASFFSPRLRTTDRSTTSSGAGAGSRVSDGDADD